MEERREEEPISADVAFLPSVIAHASAAAKEACSASNLHLHLDFWTGKWMIPSIFSSFSSLCSASDYRSSHFHAQSTLEILSIAHNTA